MLGHHKICRIILWTWQVQLTSDMLSWILCHRSSREVQCSDPGRSTSQWCLRNRNLLSDAHCKCCTSKIIHSNLVTLVWLIPTSPYHFLGNLFVKHLLQFSCWVALQEDQNCLFTRTKAPVLIKQILGTKLGACKVGSWPPRPWRVIAASGNLLLLTHTMPHCFGAMCPPQYLCQWAPAACPGFLLVRIFECPSYDPS